MTESSVEAAKWYVVNVYSGLERNVVEGIKFQAGKRGLLDRFEDFLVPTEQTVEMRRNAKVTVTRNCFPGYVFVKVRMSDDVWSLICGVPRVNGFLGTKKPQPVPEAEIARVMEQVRESQEKPRSVIAFEVGEMVKVCEGPFTSFTGTIEEVDELKERLTVSIMIFGRPTPIDLEFNQVEKA